MRGRGKMDSHHSTPNNINGIGFGFMPYSSLSVISDPRYHSTAAKLEVDFLNSSRASVIYYAVVSKRVPNKYRPWVDISATYPSYRIRRRESIPIGGGYSVPSTLFRTSSLLA